MEYKNTFFKKMESEKESVFERLLFYDENNKIFSIL